MKFVVSYKVRESGSLADRVNAGDAAQKLLANWAPSATIHQWVQRCDGTGGFAVSETDDAATIYNDLAVWSAWLEFEVIPVMDIAEAVPLQQEALEKARTVI